MLSIFEIELSFAYTVKVTTRQIATNRIQAFYFTSNNNNSKF